MQTNFHFMRTPLYTFPVLLFFFLFLPRSVPAQGNAHIARKSRALSDRMKYYKALSLCDGWLAGHPRDPLVLAARGDVYYALYDLFAAAQDYRAALRAGYDGEDTVFLRIFSDTATLVQLLVNDPAQRVRLDPRHGYRYLPDHADTLRGMLTPPRTCYDIVHEQLHVKVMPSDSSIAGSNTLRVRMTVDSCRRLQLDLFPQYIIDTVTLNGRILSWHRDGAAFFLALPPCLRKDTLVTLRVVYHGRPQVAKDPPWQGGFVWQKTDGRYNVGVACEHLGASSWWPTKDHLSDKPDSMDILITVPPGYVAVANGHPTDTTPAGNGWRTFAWHVSYPIVNYNVTFYMGDYLDISEPYTTIALQRTQIDYYLRKDHLDQARDYYRRTRTILSDLERLFGEYPFPRDGIGYVEAPYEGMEHQSAIAIGNAYDDTSGYQIYDGFPMLVVHETAHEWWGNAVSPEDMADLWLNEGLATYTEDLFLEREFGHERYLKYVGQQMLMVNNIWPVVGPRDINYNAFMGEDVYMKGAAMLHSLRSVFNDDKAFLTMLRDYYEKFRYRTVNTYDFILHAEKYTDRPLRPFFYVYLFQKDPPVLEYSFYRVKKKKQLILRYFWRGVPRDFSMPFLLLSSGVHRIMAKSEPTMIRIRDTRDFIIVTPGLLSTGVLKDDLRSSTYFYTRYVPFTDEEAAHLEDFLRNEGDE